MKSTGGQKGSIFPGGETSAGEVFDTLKLERRFNREKRGKYAKSVPGESIGAWHRMPALREIHEIECGLPL